MYSICVDRDQSRLNQLELILFFIVSVNLQTVSVLWANQVQRHISCNLQSLICYLFGDMVI